MTLSIRLWTLWLVLLSSLCLSTVSCGKDRIRYYINGADGSPLRVVDEKGNTVAAYRYSPFGESLAQKKPVRQVGPSRFVGGIEESNDLVYLKHRYYNPRIGRFYQPDPVNFLARGARQANRYQYGGNDPYMFKDANGREVIGVFSGNTAAFIDMDTYMPGVESKLVSPAEYRFSINMTLPYNQIMVFNNVFSGENRSGDFKSNFDYMIKPTPVGKYEILENTFSKNKDWYRLDPMDVPQRDDLWNDLGIGQIRLHRGLISHACVTFDNRYNSANDWGRLQYLLQNTSSTQVPVKSVIKQYGGLKSTELYGTATRYGVFYVK